MAIDDLRRAETAQIFGLFGGWRRGIGSGPQHELPDELFERLGLTRDKAEDALDKVLQAEAALRELASQFNHTH